MESLLPSLCTAYAIAHDLLGHRGEEETFPPSRAQSVEPTCLWGDAQAL